MDAVKMQQIARLESKENWETWRYKIRIALKGIPGAIEVVNGLKKKPSEPAAEATDPVKKAYEKELAAFEKVDSQVLLLMTNAMSEDTLRKVMRFNTALEVWQELHRIFDAVSEDKAYELCTEFFGYQWVSGDDVATHMSKLKNIWNSMKIELSEGTGDGKVELPEVFLICKILGTLPEDYFSFKSSWMMMSKTDRTVDNLTNQLCAYERVLKNKGGEMSKEEVLYAEKPESKKKKDIACFYCKKKGHMKKQCKKWIADGKPPKPKSESPPEKKEAAIVESQGLGNQGMTLMVVESSAFTAEGTDLDNWYVDNGATSHLTPRKDVFKTFEVFRTPHGVTAAGKQVLEAVGQGTVELDAVVNGKSHKITLSDVWYVPRVAKNLFFVLYAQDKMSSSKFESKATQCWFKVGKKTWLSGERRKYGGLYKLAAKAVTSRAEVNAVTAATGSALQLYHERMGHQNKRHVQKIVKRDLGIDVELDGEVCEGCIYGKTHRMKFKKRPRATKVGETIHTDDVCGHFVKSGSGYRYYVLFKDDFSRFRRVYAMKHKSGVVDCLKQYLAECKTFGHTIQELLCDNGKEFDNAEVRKVLSQFGVRQRLTMPYTPEQNGSSERENRTLVEMARTMMYAGPNKSLPQSLWAELINSAQYILNRTGPSLVEGKSPYELWTGKKPSVKHLRIIGTTCYVHIPKQKRKKMDKKAQKGILLGYDGDDGYRILCDNKLVRSRDVTFDETMNEPVKQIEGKSMVTLHLPENEEPEELVILEPLSREEDEVEVTLEPLSSDESEGTIEPEIEGTAESETERTEESLSEDERDSDRDTVISEQTRQLRDRSQIPKIDRYESDAFMASTDILEPETYTEAVQSKEKVNWLAAMKSEIGSLKENDTWMLCNLPKGKKAISCKWVYKVKTNAEGCIERYKARLVIKGFSQKKGVDYTETFSPVAKLTTVRTILAVAASEKMVLSQFDVSTAFLYGQLKEEVYMKQPEGYEDGSGKVCRLKRSLYGLKQAPRCWNMHFGKFLKEHGFETSTAEPCLFIRKRGNQKLLLALYVDDGLIAATCKKEADDFIEELKSQFKITVKPANYFLGLEIEQKEDGTIKVGQAAYARKILKRFGMDECRSTPTPIVKDGESKSGRVFGNDKEKKIAFPYRSAVGALMYLMCGTRPDISYAIGVVSRNLQDPKDNDVIKVKRIFRYLQGTTEYGLVYKAKHKIGRLEAYSDADHGGDLKTGRSTSGTVCLYAGGAISWLSQRQASVAISTTEAEIVAASEGAREVVWLKRLLEEVVEFKGIPELYVDNEAAIKLAHNPEYHRRTKHIRIRHFFVREMVQGSELEVKRVSTEDQLADAMTKPLHKPRLRKLCSELGLGD